MRVGPFQVNAGMAVAMVLLAAGGAAMVFAPNPTLHAAGLGVVILAAAVYLVSRVLMILKDRRS